MPDQNVGVLRSFMESYGAYAFGVVAFCVIIFAATYAIILLWEKVAKPLFIQWQAISASNANSAASLERASADIRETSVIQARTAEYQAKHADSLSALASSLAILKK